MVRVLVNGEWVEFATRQLVRILSDLEANELSVFAVYPHGQFLPPKVRSFIDFLAERFGPEPYWNSSGRQQ
jgi:DNA-binding transcriptional LysR family regulator